MKILTILSPYLFINNITTSKNQSYYDKYLIINFSCQNAEKWDFKDEKHKKRIIFK